MFDALVIKWTQKNSSTKKISKQHNNRLDDPPRLFAGVNWWKPSTSCAATLPHCSAGRTQHDVLVSNRHLSEAYVLRATTTTWFPQLISRDKRSSWSRLMSAVAVGDRWRRRNAMHHRRWRTVFFRSWSLCLGPHCRLMTRHPLVLTNNTK